MASNNMLLWSDHLGSLFCVLFAAVFLGVPVALFPALILWEQGGSRRRAARWVFVAYGVLIAAVVITAGAIFFMTRAGARNAVSTVRSHRQGRVVLVSKAGSHELNDRAAVDELFSLIDAAVGVGAHHSSPVDNIEIVFPDDGYSFLIGRDSAQGHPDEYWFQLKEYPGKSPNRG